MKKIIVMLALAVIAGQSVMNAQEAKSPGERKEKPSFEEMSQRKAERMAMELALDDATAKEFIELYKGRMKDQKALKDEYKGQKAAKGEKKSVYRTDAEVEKKIKDGFDRRQKKLDMDRRHYDEFRKVLGPKQIQKMYKIESQNEKAHKAKMEQKRNQAPKDSRPQSPRPQPGHQPRGRA